MQEQQRSESQSASEVVGAYVAADINAANTFTEAELVGAIKSEHERADTFLRNGDALLKAGVVHSLREGHFLNEAKSRPDIGKRGKWLPWLKSNGISPRTAQVRMKLAGSTNAQRAAFLSAQSIRGALRLLGGGQRRKRAETYCCPGCGYTWDGHPRRDRRATPLMAADPAEQERQTV